MPRSRRAQNQQDGGDRPDRTNRACLHSVDDKRTIWWGGTQESAPKVLTCVTNSSCGPLRAVLERNTTQQMVGGAHGHEQQPTVGGSLKACSNLSLLMDVERTCSFSFPHD